MSRLYILLSALCWALYAAYAEEARSTDVFSVIFYSQVSAAICSSLFARNIAKSVSRAFEKKNVWLTFVIVVTPVVHQVFFIFAARTLDTHLVLFIFELWPVLIIPLAPFLSGIAFRSITHFQFWAFAVSTLGFFIIAIGPTLTSTSSASDFNLQYFLGILLAVGGAISIALTALKVLFTNRVVADETFRGTITTNFISRSLSLIPLFIICLLIDADLSSTENIYIGAVAGVFLHFLSPIFGDEGIRISKEPGDFLIFYYAPIFGSVVLYLFYDAPLSDAIIIGGCLIICANIYSSFRFLRRLDFPVAIVATTLFMLACYLKKSDSSGTLLNLSAVATFFAIISSFLLQRLQSRSRRVIRDTIFYNADIDRNARSDIANDVDSRAIAEHQEMIISKYSGRHRFDVYILAFLYVSIVSLCYLSFGEKLAMQISSISIFMATTFIMVSTIDQVSGRYIARTCKAIETETDDGSEHRALIFALAANLFLFFWLYFDKHQSPSFETPILKLFQ